MSRYHTMLSRGVSALGLLVVLVAAACEPSSETGPTAESSSPSSASTSSESASSEQGSGPHKEASKHGEGSESHESHGHHGGIRLGLKMQHISHRFAAIWYAGRAQRLEMLDYQMHELRETTSTVIEADLEEHGVDVGAQLEATVLSRLEGLETAAKQGDIETFESRYETMRQSCNSCHTATQHGFIEVTTPTRPPYTNVDLSSK